MSICIADILCSALRSARVVHMMWIHQLTVFVIRNGMVISSIRFLSKAWVSATNLVMLGRHALVLSWALRTSSSSTSRAHIMSLSTTVSAKMNPSQVWSNCCAPDGFLQRFNILKLSLHSSALKTSMNSPSKAKQIYMLLSYSSPTIQ